MSDFNSGFWNVYITVITLAGILACAALLWRLSTKRLPPGQKAGVMGHVWDENLEEYNNPLPRWWMWLFYITIVFSLGYLLLYPGLGSFPGLLNWTSHSQYEAEEARAKQTYEPIFARYAADADPRRRGRPAGAGDRAAPVPQLLCAVPRLRCPGGNGFPNLTDNDWLYGGDPATIVATITNGRKAAMPAWESVVGDEGVKNLANCREIAGRHAFRLRARRARQGPVPDQLRRMPRTAGQGQPGDRRAEPDGRDLAVRRQ